MQTCLSWLALRFSGAALRKHRKNNEDYAQSYKHMLEELKQDRCSNKTSMPAYKVELRSGLMQFLPVSLISFSALSVCQRPPNLPPIPWNDVF